MYDSLLIVPEEISREITISYFRYCMDLICQCST